MRKGNLPAYAEDDMLKYDDKGKLESEDLPVDRGEVALVVPEAAVETRLLQKDTITLLITKKE
jgi:hypothetical protein